MYEFSMNSAYNRFLYYQAWSRIVHTLIPNAAILSRHLTTFAEACSATEVILFERATFLVIATSQNTASSQASNTATSTESLRAKGSDIDSDSEDEGDPSNPHGMVATRYERTSELIKVFKRACTQIREDFHSLEMELPEYTAVLDELTKSTYVMVVVHDPTIGVYNPTFHRFYSKLAEQLRHDLFACWCWYCCCCCRATVKTGSR